MDYESQKDNPLVGGNVSYGSGDCSRWVVDHVSTNRKIAKRGQKRPLAIANKCEGNETCFNQTLLE